MPKPILKRMWQDIVKQKIENQAITLKLIQDKSGYNSLMKLKDSVLSGDSTNIEARAASLYFKEIFGDGFTRRDNHFYNSALNCYEFTVAHKIIGETLSITKSNMFGMLGQKRKCIAFLYILSIKAKVDIIKYFL